MHQTDGCTNFDYTVVQASNRCLDKDQLQLYKRRLCNSRIDVYTNYFKRKVLRFLDAPSVSRQLHDKRSIKKL